MAEDRGSGSEVGGVKTVLHVDCGPYNPAELHKTFHGPGWRELPLDIDPQVAPDIVASMAVLPLAGQGVAPSGRRITSSTFSRTRWRSRSASSTGT